MIYRHKNFQLDTESRKVFNNYGKELQITGNSYRLFEFLCEKRNATLTEIGEYLDHAKEYTENHIRQYRYKINTIIGEDVLEYKNNTYSIIGDVEVVDNLSFIKNSPEVEKHNRITDLLHQDSLMLGLNMKNISRKPAIIASILLLLTFFPWAYGYYTILRWAVSLISIYYIIGFYSKQKVFDYKIWILVFIAVLFNPIAPIYLYSKTIWGIVDLVVAVFFIYLVAKLKKSIKNEKKY